MDNGIINDATARAQTDAIETARMNEVTRRPTFIAEAIVFIILYCPMGMYKHQKMPPCSSSISALSEMASLRLGKPTCAPTHLSGDHFLATVAFKSSNFGRIEAGP